jgi:hypothetical protein
MNSPTHEACFEWLAVLYRDTGAIWSIEIDSTDWGNDNEWDIMACRKHSCIISPDLRK